MAGASRGAQAIISCDIGLWLIAQHQSRWRCHIWLVGRGAIHQPVEQVQNVGFGWNAGLQYHFHRTKHGLLIVMQHQRQDIDHFSIPAGLAQHLILQLSEGIRHLDKRSPVAKCPRLALNHRQIVTPIIDDASRPVRALNNTLMRANHMPFGD